MNHIYRIVWNAATGVWQAVAEVGTGRSKGKSLRRARRHRRALLAAALASLSLQPSFARTGILPTNGTVVAGNGTVNQNGVNLTINQATNKLAIDWQSFSIGAGNTVQFIQPSSSSVALNRVTGSEVSQIQGALKANGHVFLLNPNGVLFSPTAQVEVGALLASTLDMRQDDFTAGRYRLTGNSANSVINQSNIHTAPGGGVALVAAKVSNSGTISSELGSVLMGSGSDVLVDFGGSVKLAVNKGAVDALIENSGAVRADGGNVIMKANTAGDLVSTVINNTGVIQARTLATGEKGQIVLIGDMNDGRVDIGGTLDASAPNGGDGGFIETSAAHVETSKISVNAGAANGNGGEWLIDPYDYTINATAAANITNALNLGTSVTVTTQSNATNYGATGTGTGSGDITVASAITKSSGGNASLTLRADHNIYVNSAITSTAGKLNLTLSSANAANATTGGVSVNADIMTNGGKILIGGGTGTSTNGIGYALNLNNTSAAVVVEQNRKILSQGGAVTINGKSLVGSSSGSYRGDTGGVYVKSGATILSGTGNMVINGESAGGSHTFGFAVEANSGTTTTLGSGTGGGSMQLNAVNSTAGATQTDRDEGAIGLVSYGSRERVYLEGPSVASWLVFVNGTAQLSAYTQAPQLSSCATPYPNCGTMVIPGSNNSYLYATYKSVSMATQAAYVIKSGNGTKVYDGNTTATGVTLNTLGGPAGFAVGNLTPTPAFYTESKNVGTYDTLVPAGSNPTSYSHNGTQYAVGYFGTGTYTITPKAITPIAVDKQYDGTTTASISASGLVSGDAVTLNGTGNFSSANVGNYNVNVTGITLGGADAANYSLGSNAATANANITKRDLTVSATKTYDGSASFSSVNLGNLVAGETLNYSGATANSSHVGTATYINALTLSDGTGLASNYQLPSLSSASASNSATITPKALTVTGLTAANKTYDGTTAATVSGGTLSGMVGSETLTLGPIIGSFANANAGTAKAVTLTGASLTDGTGLASDYTVASPSGLTADITQRSLNVSGITAQDKTYDGSTSATLDTTAVQLGNLVAGDVGQVGVTATGTFADANAAAGKTVNFSAQLTGNAANNYTFGGQTTTTASITPKALTFTGLLASDKVYDGTTTASLSGGTLSGLVGSETLTHSALTGNFANANVGTAKAVTLGAVTLTDGTGLASNYTVVSPSSLSASITPKALTMTGLTAADKVYDGNTAASVTGGTLTGLIGAETLSFNVTGANFNNKNVGTGKAVTGGTVNLVNGTGLASNYTVNTPTGLTAAITPKALNLTGASVSSKVYDGTTTATVSGGTLSGMVAGETLSYNVTGATFNDANAGTNKAVTLAGLGLVDGTGQASNYTLATPGSLVGTITPKALTFSGLVAADKVYDGTTTASLSGGTLTGLVGSETLTHSGLTGVFANANVGTAKAVTLGLVSLTNGTGLASNYSVVTPSSLNASITPKALTLTGLAAADKVYDGSTTASVTGGTLSGLVGSESLSFNVTGASFSNKNVGTGKGVTLASVNLVNGTGLASNYTVNTPTGLTAAITPKALSLTGASVANKVYDGTTTATVSGGTLSGMVAGETVTYNVTGANFADKDAGTSKAVALAGLGLVDGTGLASNYSLATPTGLVGTITPKALTLNGLVASDKVYDGGTTASVSGGTLNGLVGSETLGVNVSASFGDKNVGSGKSVAVSGINLVNGTGLATNYTVTGTANLTAAITPKSISLNGVNVASKVYDGSTTANISGGTLSGLVAGETLNFNVSGASFNDANAGTNKAVSVSGFTVSNGTGLASNYSLSSPTGLTGTITPKALTVTGMTVADKVYDGSTVANVSNGTLNGLVGTETLSFNVTGANFNNANVGTNKAVSVGGVSLTNGTGIASNYTVTSPTSLSGAVTPKALTLNGVTVATKVYDGSTTADISGGTLSGLVAGEALNFNVAGANFNNANAGTNKAVTVGGVTLTNGTGTASNYVISTPVGLAGTITPKALTITGLVATDKVYDGTTAVSVSGGKLNGLVGSETLGVNLGDASLADKNAGVNKAVTVTGVALTNGTGLASNYSIAPSATSTATVTPKQLTVANTAIADKTSDGTAIGEIASVGTLTGVIQGDAVVLTGPSATATFTQTTPGTAIPVQVAGLTLTGTDAPNYRLPASVPTVGNIITRTTVADGARYAAALPELPKPFISSMGYVAVADSAAASGSASAASSNALASVTDPASNGASEFGGDTVKQPATQGSAEGRESKFLSVFVVGGGIQMPAAEETEEGRARKKSPAAQ